MGKITFLMLSIFYCILLLGFTLVYFVFFAVLYCVTVLFDRERLILHEASRIWSKCIYRFCPLWQVDLEGLEKIERGKPYVIVTNHQAMLDIPLMYVLPLNFKWVAKKEVLRMPIFGWVLRMHGDLAIERGSSRSARQMMEQAGVYLSRGTSVIFFPEGTRSKTGRVGRFKEGAFLLAQTAGVGVIPVVHEGNGSVLNGWRLRMPHSFRVKVLDPITPQAVAAMSVRELTAEVERRITAAHREISSQRYEVEVSNNTNRESEQA